MSVGLKLAGDKIKWSDIPNLPQTYEATINSDEEEKKFYAVMSMSNTKDVLPAGCRNLTIPEMNGE